MATPELRQRRKRRPWLILIPVILLIVVGLALALPGSPIYLAKLLEPEPKVDGRTTSELIAALGSGDKEQRTQAAEDLGKLNTAGRKALPKLLEVMRSDPEAEVRAAAADAAGKMYPATEPDAAKSQYAAAVLDVFTAGLTDKDGLVRHNSALGLIKLKDKARPAVPTLLTAYKDPENDTNLKMYHATVRQVMLRALGEAAAGTADAVPTFAAILAEKVVPPKLGAGAQQRGGKVTQEDEEASKAYIQATINRRIAVAGLGLAGEHASEYAPQIRELLKSSEADDRIEAKQALERMGLSADGG
jgi:HEAT repeat protein